MTVVGGRYVESKRWGCERESKPSLFTLKTLDHTFSQLFQRNLNEVDPINEFYLN